ncbi:SymE family type I addiction module toxin [Yersinia intermedia]|uniref:SymE family type I addiction module toxin n=1 Tax=Yersinia intermedia TaxID=631 RepID=UPI0022FDCE81|nr:SymE family type I addiction module toxin [Yersinia intermedia]MDA5494142.1 SymE family type I addiction module toxin [Yersinia intermedia]
MLRGAEGVRPKIGRVYPANSGRPNPLPQLTLKGRWLEPLGFTTEQRIEVITEPGQLIIRLVADA